MTLQVSINKVKDAIDQLCYQKTKGNNLIFLKYPTEI